MRHAPMPLALERKGSFTADFDGDTDSKCGRPDINTFEFKVVCRGTDEHLSPEGFLIENSRIASYFDARYGYRQPVRSCEQIACDAARQIGEKMLKERISVLSVSCTIVGSNAAQITATWFAPGRGAFDSGAKEITL